MDICTRYEISMSNPVAGRLYADNANNANANVADDGEMNQTVGTPEYPFISCITL